jgi:hypothetical protein
VEDIGAAEEDAKISLRGKPLRGLSFFIRSKYGQENNSASALKANIHQKNRVYFISCLIYNEIV